MPPKTLQTTKPGNFTVLKKSHSKATGIKATTQSGKVAAFDASTSSPDSLVSRKRPARSSTSPHKSKKKAKLAAKEIIEISSDEDEKEVVQKDQQVALTDGKREELEETLRLKLLNHTPRSMTAVMAAISYEACYLSTNMDEMIEEVVTELMMRAMDGGSIDQELAAIDNIGKGDDCSGKSSSRAKGISKEVQQRLDRAEDMLDSLSKKELKAVMKDLGHFSSGGSNSMMAEEIVQTLYHQAHRGGDLKEEYSIIKGYCYEACGECSDDEDL